MTTSIATLNVLSVPVIATNPTSQNSSNGTAVTFTASATGNPTPTIQWQVSTNGGPFANIAGATQLSLTFTSTIALSGNQYQAVFTNSEGAATTTVATLTVPTVLAAPLVTTSPTSQTISAGSSVTFTAAASGNPTPTIQWQVSVNGAAFADIANANSSSLTFATTSSESGNQYRAVFLNSQGSAATSPVGLTVLTAPVVSTSPTSQSITAGASVTFTSAASGNPTPTIQWQVSTNGAAFANIANATSSSLTFSATADLNGNQYQAVFTNSQGSATTSIASLSVLTVPVVTTSPTSQSVSTGSSVTFTAAASGNPTPTIQWQVSVNGAAYANITNANSTSLTFTSTASENGNQYRAVFTNSQGSASTTPITLSVLTVPKITTSPASQNVTAGSNVTFTAAASGNPTPTIQWQMSANGGAFANITNATSLSLSFVTTASESGNQYQAVFTNSQGSVTTTAASLNVLTAPAITTNPASQSVSSGSNVTFTAAANGNPTPTVQWQVSINGAAYANVPNANSPSLTFTTTASESGNQYRAVFTNSLGLAATSPASLSVLTVPAVTSSPTSQSVSAGANVTFTAAASGNPNPTVQWQVSTNGGPFTNIANATSASLTFTPTAAQSGNQYQAVFTNTQGSATTSAATLNVLTAPAITTSPLNQSISDGSSVTFTAAASGNPTPTVQWQVSVNGAPYANIANANSTSLTFTATAAQAGNQYRAAFTNSQGLASTTPADLNVLTVPMITTSPTNQSVSAGSSVTFSAVASGNPTPTVQWQVSVNGGSFTNITNANSSSFTLISTAAQNGNQYQAVFTNSQGSKTTTAASLSVVTAPAITTNPTSQTISAGSSVTFTATASGNPTPTIQWQVSVNGAAFTNIANANLSSLTFTPTAAQSGNQYQAVFTNSQGSAATTAASLNVLTAPVITVNPSNTGGNAGTTVTFTAAASGNPTPTVQWQVSNNGGPFANIANATLPTLSFTTSAAMVGNQYRAVFTSSQGSTTTTAATLTAQRMIVVDLLGDTSQIGHTTLRDAINTANGDVPGDVISYASSLFANGPAAPTLLLHGPLTINNSMTIQGAGPGVLTISGQHLQRIFDVAYGVGSLPSQVTISGMTMTQGNGGSSLAPGSGGGALFNAAQLTLTNDVFTGNSLANNGGNGGAILNTASLTLANDVFSSNTAGGNGGAIASSNSLISTNDIFTGNLASSGGGGGVANSGAFTSTTDTFTGNSETGVNGGGGGILNVGGSVVSSGDLFSANRAAFISGIGGGIENDGQWTSTNDTFTGNVATFGGGIFTFASGGGSVVSLTTINDTIAANQQANFNNVVGTGGGVWTSGTWNSVNTIVAGNLSGTLASDVVQTGGTITAHNTLIGDAATSGSITNGGVNNNIVGRSTSSIFVVDINGKPLLTNNGGMTQTTGGPSQTIALANGSPAIAAGGPLTTLSGPLTATATSCTVNDSTYIAVGDLLRIDSEIVQVTKIAGTAVVLLRGQGGTTSATHLASASFNQAYDQRGIIHVTNDMGAVAAATQISVVDASGTYTGFPFAATVTATGFGGVKLSGVTTVTYFSGTSPSGTGLTTAPTAIGTYTVVATFSSSTYHYADVRSAPVTFTISPGAAAKLAFSPPLPATLVAGSSTGLIGVQVEDKFGNPVPNDNSTLLTLNVNGLAVSTMTDINGVVTFNAVSLTRTGSNLISVTSNSTLTPASATVVVSASVPTHLAYLSVPYASIVAGITMAPVRVAIEDIYNNVVTSDTNQVGFSFATLSGTGSGPTSSPTISTANGVTSFSNMIFDVTGRYSMTVSDPADGGVVSLPSPVVTAVNPAQSAAMAPLQSLPLANATAGVASHIQIGIYDQFGNLQMGDQSVVTLTVNSGGTLSNGQTTIAAHTLNGIASFTPIFNQRGTYSLTVSDPESSLNSGSISLGNLQVNSGAASQLVLSSSLPATLVAGGFTGPISVQVQDAFGNLVTNDTSTLTLSVNGAAVSTMTDSSGVVTFNSVQLTSSGNIAIGITSSPALHAISASIAVTRDVPTHLAYLIEPASTANTGDKLAPVKIAIEDVYNNILTTDTNSISLFANNNGLLSNPTVSAVNGVATFNNLIFGIPGSYTLTATDNTDLPGSSYTSTSVNVTLSVPSQLAIVPSLPATLPAGGSTGPITVQVEDKAGNLIASDNSTAITLNVNGVAVSTQTDVNGIVTFSSEQFTKPGKQTFSVTSSPALTAASAAVMITPGTPTQLAFLSLPNASIVAGNTEGPVKVAVEDAYGNIVTSDTNQVSYSFAALSGTGSGPTSGPTISTTNGMTTFSNMVFDVTGRYSMTVSDPADAGVASLTSSVITTVNSAAATQMLIIHGLPTTDATAGVAVSQVQIGFYDQFGNLKTNDSSVMTVSLGGGQQFANGQTTMIVHPLNGIANINSTFNVAGIYTLTATDPEATLTAGTVNLGSLKVDPAAAYVLVFVPSLPTTLAAGTPTGAIVVKVEDRYGNVVTSPTSVTLKLNGTTVQTVTSSNGSATFNSLILSKLGSNSISAVGIGLSQATATITVS